MPEILPANDAVAALKAAAEPTRLRILLLLQASELNVKDLTRILGQSQPRISRHLKLLVDAGLIDRSREGSWVYFHSSALAHALVAHVDPKDKIIARDRDRASALKLEREKAAQGYFEAHAADWDQIRSLYVDEVEVEAAMLAALGGRRYDTLIDLGTGTGRMLELFAGHFAHGLGIDLSLAMLAYARSKLDRSLGGAARLRHGDLYELAVGNGSVGAVVMHQVLHFLSDPSRAIREAARVLEPGGDLLIVDFAPHELEFLRERFAHARLGFARGIVEQWAKEAGLVPVAARDLEPPASDGAGKLTVSLWLARRPGPVPERADASSGRHALEIAR